MEIPFYSLLIIYAIGVLVFFVFSIFDIYHLIRYESFTTRSKIYLSIYVFIFIGLVVAPLLILNQVDWFDTFTLFGNGPTRY